MLCQDAIKHLVDIVEDLKPQTVRIFGDTKTCFIVIFHCHYPSSRTVALGSTQSLTEMSTRNISWGGKGGRCLELTNLSPSCADCLEICEPQTAGNPWVRPGL